MDYTISFIDPNGGGTIIWEPSDGVKKMLSTLPPDQLEDWKEELGRLLFRFALTLGGSAQSGPFFPAFVKMFDRQITTAATLVVDVLDASGDTS